MRRSTAKRSPDALEEHAEDECAAWLLDSQRISRGCGTLITVLLK